MGLSEGYALKKAVPPRRKHMDIKCTVTLPNVDEPLVFMTSTTLKVKNLRELIKEKAPMQA